MFCGGADPCQAQEGMGREVVAPSVPRALPRTDRLVSTGEPALRPAPSRGDTHTPAPRRRSSFTGLQTPS